MLRRLCPVCCTALCACSSPRPVDAQPAKRAQPVTASDASVREPTAQSDAARVPAKPAAPLATSLPDGWSDLRALPGLRFDLVYAGSDNFTGAPVPGYAGAGAWLHEDAASALLRVHQSLAKTGLGLLIFDAYRPQRASEHFVQWARDNGRSQLVREGYIAKRSLHNRGVALDLGLVRLEDGLALHMGSAFDTFDPSAHYLNAEGDAMEARRTLREAMIEQGFRPYAKEWWHFTYAPQGYEAPEALDLPYPAN